MATSAVRALLWQPPCLYYSQVHIPKQFALVVSNKHTGVQQLTNKRTLQIFDQK